MNKKLNIVLNIVLIVTTIGAVGTYFCGATDFLGSSGVNCFRFFTTDSNLLAAVGSAAYVTFLLQGRPMPKWVTVLKFAGTVAVTITLATVAFFLGPLAVYATGDPVVYLWFFEGNSFVLHLTSPVLAIITTLFIERDHRLTFRESLWGIVPVFVYAIVYTTMVVVVGAWPDFYGFTFGGHVEVMPLVVAAMLLIAFGICAAERRIKNGKKRAE